MNQNATMVINRETAMFLWGKSFGKATKAKDFAGREIVKAAYDQRGSAYGWNVDHILPQSRGGKTTESNLICCHIQTNDEKADKFPCFTANDRKFEIIKVQNHYEIRQVSSGNDNVANSDDSVNFYDSAAGIRLFKKLKSIQNKKIFVGTVVIRLSGIQTTAIIDFIEKLFEFKSISFSRCGSTLQGLCFTPFLKLQGNALVGLDGENMIVRINDYHIRLQEDTADMLDRCLLLNTYLGKYFVAKKDLIDYKIFYGEHIYSSKVECLTTVNDFESSRLYRLAINGLVRDDTSVKDEDLPIIGQDRLGNAVYQYDYVYDKLAENLTKSIK